jgi:hypothetical protein
MRKEYIKKKNSLIKSIEILNSVVEKTKGYKETQLKNITKYKNEKTKFLIFCLFLGVICFSVPLLFFGIVGLIASCLFLIVISALTYLRINSLKELIKREYKYMEEDIVDITNFTENISQFKIDLQHVNFLIESYDNYISERENSFKMNIDDFSIGDTFKDGKITITNKSKNSIEVLIKCNENFYSTEFTCTDCGEITILDKNKKFKCSKCKSIKNSSEKKLFSGVDNTQWFTMSDFNKLIK